MQETSWLPITSLGTVAYQDFTVDLARLDTIRSIWDHTKLELTPEVQGRFAARLKRSIAVETGVIEGLYELDRGLTRTLVTHGFARDTVDRAGESVPDSTLSMLRDHLRGLDFIMDYIGEAQRDLTTAYIRELHALVTDSQTTYKARDQFVGQIDIDLEHGVYKTQPNNPSLHGGGIHEYAPVEQVASQMDELVRLFEEMDEHTVVKAAWLHHRFVQIHPFQDGNGRVARLLASMVLVKDGYFPLYIRRDDREAYLGALEQADAGRLEPFIKLLSHRLRQDLLSAVSDAAKAAAEQMPAAGAASRTRDVAALVAARRQRHRAEVLEQRRQVNQVAEDLLPQMVTAVETRLGEAQDEFDALRVPFLWRVESGGSHDVPARSHWWSYQIVQTARRLDYWANQSENKYWIRSDLALDEDRLRMVVSLHHYGLPVSGIMAVSAFAELLHRASADDHSADQQHVDRELVDCIDSEFTFSKADAGEQLRRDLESWLDDAMAVTLRVLGAAAG